MWLFVIIIALNQYTDGVIVTLKGGNNVQGHNVQSQHNYGAAPR